VKRYVPIAAEDATLRRTMFAIIGQIAEDDSGINGILIATSARGYKPAGRGCEFRARAGHSRLHSKTFAAAAAP
jgi:hypothetical protein